ncbi:DJ-1/PfpI family protein [Bradyrhizobium sp. USDA 4353]
MKLGIPVYQGVNLLDVAGPLEMFYWAGQIKSDFEAILISEDGQAVTSINEVRFDAHASFAEAPMLDILWVPGGKPEALETIMRDPDSAYLNYLRQIAPNATWVCSVCEGALLLARAGLLDHHEATTHWAFVDCLKKFPAIKVDTTYKRFLVSGNRLTGGGISSGLDESLELIRLIFGADVAKDVQRTTQYFPQPPVHAQLPANAPRCDMVWE